MARRKNQAPDIESMEAPSQELINELVEELQEATKKPRASKRRTVVEPDPSFDPVPEVKPKAKRRRVVKEIGKIPPYTPHRFGWCFKQDNHHENCPYEITVWEEQGPIHCSCECHDPKDKRKAKKWQEN